MSADDYVLHVLVDRFHLHSCFRPELDRPLRWPGALWSGLWCFPGRLSKSRNRNRGDRLPGPCANQLLCQTLTTAYACEVVPTVLRPYVTAYVCMCWGAGILLSSGTVRATLTINSDWAWRLPFTLQWIWPVPLIIAAYLAPESPWNSVRRGKIEEARNSLRRLRQKGPDVDAEVDASLAYIMHTTHLEMAETSGGRFIDCFRGTNLRRTEIVSLPQAPHFDMYNVFTRV